MSPPALNHCSRPIRCRPWPTCSGRDLRFQGQPDDEVRAEMTKTTPVEYIDAFSDFYVTGSLDESHVWPTVRDVLARAPRSFEQWARAHAGAFT